MSSNLIYIFLTKDFLSPKDAPNNKWSYDTVPKYYTQTFNFNSQKFDKSYILTENSQIKNFKNKVDTSKTEILSVEGTVCGFDEFKETINILDKAWIRYRYDTFWFVTFIRSIIIGIFIDKFNLTNTIHTEADNIVFSNNVKTIFDIFDQGEFGYPNEAPFASALALMAFKDRQSGYNFFKHHITLLKKGDEILNPHVGHFSGHVTDMAFVDLIYRAKKNYKMLPCLPYGNFSENFKELQYVFDPFTYGAYLGGTNHGAPAGYLEFRHYAGKEILENKIKVIFNKKPFIVYNEKEIPIFNLHVHNKKAIPQLLNKC